jgi:hypothetical protein
VRRAFIVSLTALEDDGSTDSAELGVCFGTGSVQLWTHASSGATVEINGVDPAQPTEIPFTWVWGDGTQTTGWFPQTHTYPRLDRAYTLTVIAHENDGTMDCAQHTIGTPPSALALGFTGGTLGYPLGIGRSFGWEFKVTREVNADGLAFWHDINAIPSHYAGLFPVSRTVALWNVDGTLLAQAEVPSIGEPSTSCRPTTVAIGRASGMKPATRRKAGGIHGLYCGCRHRFHRGVPAVEAWAGSWRDGLADGSRNSEHNVDFIVWC